MTCARQAVHDPASARGENRPLSEMTGRPVRQRQVIHHPPEFFTLRCFGNPETSKRPLYPMAAGFITRTWQRCRAGRFLVQKSGGFSGSIIESDHGFREKQGSYRRLNPVGRFLVQRALLAILRRARSVILSRYGLSEDHNDRTG